MATTKKIAPAPGAYDYQLLIKRLLLSGVRYQPDQEIVYADKLRYSYRTLNQRIARLANALTAAGVKAGDTVQSLASRMVVAHEKEGWFRVLNGLTNGQQLQPGQAPEATFPVIAKQMTAREHCNLHGLWAASN